MLNKLIAYMMVTACCFVHCLFAQGGTSRTVGGTTYHNGSGGLGTSTPVGGATYHNLKKE